VLVLLGEMPNLDTVTQTEIETFMTLSLANYEFLSLESVSFRDAAAHAFTLRHGEDTASRMFQRQLLFNKDGQAFLITLTTLAEESSEQAAEAVFEDFLNDFVIDEGNG